MTDDDLSLLREYSRNGSEKAFATLVSRHVNLVYSVARRQVGDAHLAEEITQAVFIILARKAGSLGAKTIVPGWLCRTARYAGANALTIQRRRQQREQEAYMQSMLSELSNQPVPDETWKQIAPMLDQAMEKLEKKDHDVLVLRYFEGRSFGDVSMELGSTEAAAKMRVGRALEKLRKFFLKRGVTLTAVMIAGIISANSVQAAPAGVAKSVTVAVTTKGVAVGGSTLVLIKGALKLMAWSKAKTGALAGAVVLLTLGTSLAVMDVVHLARIAAYPDIQGAWEGRMLLDDPGVAAGEAASTRVVLKLIKTADGYRAITDWIEMGRKDVPMGRVVYHYPSLQIELTPRETWKLRVNDNATQMILDHTTHFIQPDPVLLLRTATPDLVPERLTETDFRPRAGSDLQGYWEGEINPGTDAQPVALKINEQADGTFRAEVDQPTQGANGRPVTVVYNRPMVKLLAASGSGTFQGKINAANTEISGSLVQNGQTMPATVRRVDYQAKHAQDALRSYMFDSKDDLQGHWRGSWVASFGKIKVAIRMVLDIAKLPDGSYSATIANIDQFGNDDPIAASDFQCEPPQVHLKWKWTGCAYEGALKNGKLTGTWFQGGGGFPLVFERSQSQ